MSSRLGGAVEKSREHAEAEKAHQQAWNLKLEDSSGYFDGYKKTPCLWCLAVKGSIPECESSRTTKIDC